MFDKMKALMEMQKRMQEVKKQLDATVFEVESKDGVVKVSMNGSQEVKSVSIQRDLLALEKQGLEESIASAYNRAVKRSHEIAAQKMKEVSGLNIPGMP
jgi:nucleoid-associated protein EbfC